MTILEPRIRDRSRRERSAAMAPVAATYFAAILLIPWLFIEIGIPDRIAYSGMSSSVIPGYIGLYFALNTRPSTGRHLALLCFAALAMVATAQLAAVYIDFLVTAGELVEDASWFVLAALRAVAAFAVALATWTLIARATRGDGLWG